MKNNGFAAFSVVLLLSSQCNGATFNDYSSERARSSGEPESSHDMIVRKVHDITRYSFKSEALLADAFTHHSMPGTSRFRQLEFLGDKVINAVIALQTFDINKKLEDLNNTVKSKVSNKNLSRVSATLDLPNVSANPSCHSDTLAADSFEALVGAIQLDSKGSELEISPEAARFIISSLCSTKKSDKSSKALPRPRPSLVVENYSSQSLNKMTAENLNTELQRLKNILVKGVLEHEAPGIRLVIQLLELERNHRTALKIEKDKLKKSEIALSEESARFQREHRQLQYELDFKRNERNRLQQTIYRLESTITQQRNEINRLNSCLTDVEDRYSSLKNAGLVGRIFRKN